MSTVVLIGIQARLGSTRFPGKVLESLGDKPVLDHVILSAKSSLGYINEYSNRTNIRARLCLLVPETERHVYQQKIHVLKGPENNVLARYKKAMDYYKCDYIIRLTADCPLVPPYLITKIIYAGVKGGYDYFSNVDLLCRTYPDGFDVEFVSRKALSWVETHPQTTVQHKEHVTLLIRELCPTEELKMGTVLGYLDLSSLKISLDLKEDLLDIQQRYTSLGKKLTLAQSLYGVQNVQRF